MSTYLCPNCGEDAWVADYYEAVYQSITLTVGETGEPEFGEYTGILDNYDDGVTEDEAWRCRGCGYVIQLGTFTFTPNSDSQSAEKGGDA